MGPETRRSGVGHMIGPILKPRGRVQSIVVGRPESPGFDQYVCQPGGICCRSARCSGWPGTRLRVSVTRLAVTWRLCCGLVCAQTMLLAVATRADANTTRQIAFAIATTSAPSAEFVQLGDDRCDRRSVLEALLVQLGFDDAIMIENENDRSWNSISAVPRRILWIAQFVAVDHFGLRIGQQGIGDLSLGGKSRQDFGAVIGKRGYAVAPLLDLSDTTIHV